MADERGRPAWADSETMVALRHLVDRGRAVHALVSRGAGLSDHEMTSLELLAREPMGPAELSRRLGVTAPAGTGIVDRLVARGHVERTADPLDRRRVVVRVTESGRADVRSYLAPMFQALAAMDAELDDAERAVVLRYLRRAVDAFERVADPRDDRST